MSKETTTTIMLDETKKFIESMRKRIIRLLKTGQKERDEVMEHAIKDAHPEDITSAHQMLLFDLLQDNKDMIIHTLGGNHRKTENQIGIIYKIREFPMNITDDQIANTIQEKLGEGFKFQIF